MTKGYWKDGANVNSRINIKYQKGKPKVKIGIKKKKDSFLVSVGAIILWAFIFAGGVWMVCYLIPLQIAPELTSAENIDIIQSRAADGMLTLKEYETYKYSPESVYSQFMHNMSVNPDIMFFIIGTNFFGFLIIWGFNSIYKKNKGTVKALKRCYFYKVFKEVPKEGYIEIPLFRNDNLEFEAEGEFSNYLKELDIREYPYKYISLTKKHKKRKGHYWFAKFYFFEQPNNGKLEVKFR